MVSGGFEGCRGGSAPRGRPWGAWGHGRLEAAAASMGAVPGEDGRGAVAWVRGRVIPALAVPAWPRGGVPRPGLMAPGRPYVRAVGW